MGNDPELLASILAQFSEQFGTARARLAELIHQGKQEESLQLTHQIKGVAGNVGAVDVYRCAEILEHQLQAHQSTDARESFDQALRIALTSIATYLESPSPETFFSSPSPNCRRCDCARVATLFKEFLALLEDDHFIPQELLTELRGAVHCPSMREHLKRLERCIAAVDYPRARLELKNVPCATCQRLME